MDRSASRARGSSVAAGTVWSANSTRVASRALRESETLKTRHEPGSSQMTILYHSTATENIGFERSG
jgi:hypothetical protein